MLRWFAALANADTAPATLVALGDSLLFGGSLHPAVDRLVRHYNPIRFHKAVTGYGWIGGDEFEGDGILADEGGLDGNPRLLGDGEACHVTRVVVTSAVLYGVGRFEVAIDGRELGVVELSVAEPHTVLVEDRGLGGRTITLRARGRASLHGAYLGAGNERRGVRFFEIDNPGKTFRFFLDRTEASAHLRTIGPDLLVISLGVNDVAQSGVEQYEADFDTFAGRMRADLPRTALCYWFPHRPRTVPSEQWSVAREAARRVCSTHAIALVDGHAFMGSTSGEDDTEGLSYDGVHYSRLGKRLFSEALLATIAPGLHMAPHSLTSAQMQAGQLHAGTGPGESGLVGPPSDRFNILQGTAPSPLSDTGLFFSEATYLSVIDPPFLPPAGSVALFAGSDASGDAALCVRFPDGSVKVVAFED
jgi:hypothetical protein